MAAPASIGLRTVIYHVNDIGAAKRWYERVFGVGPYFDEPFYVGFNISGYELGLNPGRGVTAAGPGGTIGYWGVEQIEAAVQRFAAAGAVVKEAAHEVGDGIKVATVADPDGNLIGLIENPHFVLP